jgi:hypothetical protein
MKEPTGLKALKPEIFHRWDVIDELLGQCDRCRLDVGGCAPAA